VKAGALVLVGGAKGATSATCVTRFASYELQMETNGAGSVNLHAPDGSDYSAKLSNRNAVVRLAVSVDRVKGSSVDHGTKVGAGGVAITTITATTNGRPTELRIDAPSGSTLSLKSVKLRPVGSQSLFTGKKLDGWKVNAADPKRMASKWEVTKDGELSVKDGPGDLVSETEFDIFVLQLECKTNGKALNSGVFFRCIPGQYQNGYEAQIHNGFKDDDRTRPADFGTGAIYRRVPARKVVSNDNE
jgi:hypothetical protein